MVPLEENAFMPRIKLLDADGHVRPMKHIKDEVLDLAIRHTGSRLHAARALGIGRSTLYRHLECHER
jgi:transcriptional regulator of acetoin/glycerol metabolism